MPKPIAIKPQNRGKLHADLGIPQDQTIPQAKLSAAKETAGPAEKKRIQFAQNRASWFHR